MYCGQTAGWTRIPPTFGEVTGKKAGCLTCSVGLGTVLLKDEELARDLGYGMARNSCS